MASRFGAAVSSGEVASRLSEALQRAKVHLDGFTGAHELAKLAEVVATRDAQFAAGRSRLRDAKGAFEAALESRTATQQELNALLQVRAAGAESRRRCQRRV